MNFVERNNFSTISSIRFTNAPLTLQYFELYLVRHNWMVLESSGVGGGLSRN